MKISTASVLREKPANHRTGDPQPMNDAFHTSNSRSLLPRIKIDVFGLSADFLQTVELFRVDRAAHRAEISISKGDMQSAIERYQTNPAPPLIIIEKLESSDLVKNYLNTLADLCTPSTRLILIGDENDIVLYRELLALGVSDYLVQPVSALDLLDATNNTLNDDVRPEKIGRVFAFIGARGGVGASTLAHNIAHSLATDFGSTTLLIDANIAFGTAAMQFDTLPSRTLADALREGEALNTEVLDRLVHWREKHFGLLAAPPISGELGPPTAEGIRQVIDQARRLAQFVVLDLPASWQPWINTALMLADSISIVTTPDLPGLNNMRMLSQTLSKVRPNDPLPHLILNKVPQKGKPAVSAKEFEKFLDRKLATTIPSDPVSLSASEMAGIVLAAHNPASIALPPIKGLIEILTGRSTNPPQKQGIHRLLGKHFSSKKTKK